METVTFTDYTADAGVENEWVDTTWHPLDSAYAVGWGTALMDIDNDTWQDLWVVNGWMGVAILPTSFDDPDYLYKNNGDGTFSDITPTAGVGDPSISRGFAYADYDNDGDLDGMVVATHWDTLSTAKVLLYRNDYAGSNHYLNVKLEGVTCNRDAYGSHIKIVTGGDSWIHEVVGGSSHSSQNSSIAHFGLGASVMVDSLIITWPGGAMQCMTNIPADTSIHILEDTAACSLITSTSAPISVRGAKVQPNPFHTEANISFNLLKEQNVNLTIYNQLGQEVRNLVEENLPHGAYYLKWDGTNENNQRVQSGIYIARLTVGNEVIPMRILLVD